MRFSLQQQQQVSSHLELIKAPIKDKFKNMWFVLLSGGSLPCSPRGGERPNYGTQTEDSLWEAQLGQRVYQHCVNSPGVRGPLRSCDHTRNFPQFPLQNFKEHQLSVPSTLLTLMS